MPANCAEISKVTSGSGNWILRDLEPPEAKAFNRKYSSCIRLWNTIMKKWFRHHLENFISFPLIYRFAGIRRVLTELEADNWKHRSNYTVTLIVAYDISVLGCIRVSIYTIVWCLDLYRATLCMRSIAIFG